MINLSLTQKEKKDLTEDEQEIAMARKLEILILPQLKRHMDFFYGGANIPRKAKAYRAKMDKEQVEKYVEEKNGTISTVCKPLCDVVSEILRENGLNAETVCSDTDMFRHTDVLLTTKSGKKYIINYLEDMESIQTGMTTPNFASKEYYTYRYEKFENSFTPDGKSIEEIDFLEEDQMQKIDNNLGYKKQNMYMNAVIEQIKKEMTDFKNVMAENEWLEKEYEYETSGEQISPKVKEEEKKSIYDKYNNMTEEETIDAKIDWIFNYFNQRMDIKGHADFVMYYSRILLQTVLQREKENDYSKLTRYDCFLYEKNLPKDSKIHEILDFDNTEKNDKMRFCLLESPSGAVYAFSTKPESYVKLKKEDIDKIEEYAKVSKTERPSKLLSDIWKRGHALPLAFHPIGIKILNEREELIDKNLPQNEREKQIEEVVESIETTDEPITSISIPYPNGEIKKIYINENDEFVERNKNKEIIYHYNEQTDEFDLEEVALQGSGKSIER